MENTQSDILTVDEAAELLKIPRSSVYKLAQQGKIPAKKVGRHWRFHRQTIVNWIMDINPSINGKSNQDSENSGQVKK
jgi:excisionase family DNA binding protein